MGIVHDNILVSVLAHICIGIGCVGTSLILAVVFRIFLSALVPHFRKHNVWCWLFDCVLVFWTIQVTWCRKQWKVRMIGVESWQTNNIGWSECRDTRKREKENLSATTQKYMNNKKKLIQKCTSYFICCIVRCLYTFGVLSQQ